MAVRSRLAPRARSGVRALRRCVYCVDDIRMGENEIAALDAKAEREQAGRSEVIGRLLASAAQQ